MTGLMQRLMRPALMPAIGVRSVEPVYDADAQDYFDRAEALGGSFDLSAINATYTESYVKTAISDMVAGLKTDGVWDDITEMYLFSGVTFDGITAKLKYDTTAMLTNNNFVSGDLLAAGSGAGLTDGSTKLIDTQFAITDALNAADGFGMSIYLQTNDSTVAGRIAGARTGANNEIRIMTLSDNRISAFPGLNFGLESTGVGLFSLLAKNGEQVLYKNGSSEDTDAIATITAPTPNVYFLGVNGLTGDTTCRQSFGAIHGFLTPTQAANLSSRANALMTAIGANVY